MEITIDIPEKEAPFVLELLKKFKFLTIRKSAPQSSFADFRSEWAKLSSRLPQTDPDITEEEILAEIKAVRSARNAK